MLTSVIISFADETLPVPDWVQTVDCTDANLNNIKCLVIETPDDLPYKINYYIIKSDNSPIIIDDGDGGTVFFTEDTDVKISYVADNSISDSYETSVIIGKTEDFSDEVTGVKAKINTSSINGKISIVASFITAGDIYKAVNSSLGTFGRFLIFNINTVKNGSVFNTDAKIKWYLPVPEQFNENYISLYKTSENGELEKTDFTYENGYAVFSSDTTGIYTLYVDEKAHTGDIDLNGKITVADARLLLRYSAGLETLSDEAKKNADIDLNGKITVKDARLLLRYAAGLELLEYIDNNNN